MEIGNKALSNKAAEDLLIHLVFSKISKNIRELLITSIKQGVIVKVYNKIITTHFSITHLIKLKIIQRTRALTRLKIGPA